MVTYCWINASSFYSLGRQFWQTFRKFCRIFLWPIQQCIFILAFLCSVVLLCISPVSRDHFLNKWLACKFLSQAVLLRRTEAKTIDTQNSLTKQSGPQERRLELVYSSVMGNTPLLFVVGGMMTPPPEVTSFGSWGNKECSASGNFSDGCLLKTNVDRKCHRTGHAMIKGWWGSWMIEPMCYYLNVRGEVDTIQWVVRLEWKLGCLDLQGLVTVADRS